MIGHAHQRSNHAALAMASHGNERAWHKSTRRLTRSRKHGGAVIESLENDGFGFVHGNGIRTAEIENTPLRAAPIDAPDREEYSCAPATCRLPDNYRRYPQVRILERERRTSLPAASAFRGQ